MQEIVLTDDDYDAMIGRLVRENMVLKKALTLKWEAEKQEAETGSAPVPLHPHQESGVDHQTA